MAHLSTYAADFSVTRQKAIEDAKKMQVVVQEECNKAGQEVPPYLLRELIGKGSFGRVYKALDGQTSRVVAVKIIDIEESDTLNPKLADTYSEFLKEVNALKLLSEGGAKNINHVLDALPVGQSMWMVCEYCAGGSVATLMKPTAPGGLQEKWIIPILREVAEAIFWVHKAGIIHRDIKCANVLITEAGGVQLCDFGVSGVIETRFDKRSTFIGTPHWMAPELFDTSTSYGVEVDIWAFGSMVFEIASGLPPNVMAGIDVTQLGSYLKQHTPTLQGDKYSEKLKDLVSFCLVEDPTKRPIIEEVQHHPYLFNTESTHPTSSLAMLVKAFRVWESQGGSRKSLFALGGAQGPFDSELASTAMANDEWNFSSTVDFDQSVMSNTDAQAVYDVYGSQVDLTDLGEPTPQAFKPKRRRPPPNLPVIRAPLEKVFDPNTISNYEENARVYYGRPMLPPASDLPLRDDSHNATVRESLIDLDASLHGGRLSKFVDMETIKAGPRRSRDYEFGGEDYARQPNSDPETVIASNSRKTQEWKFPVMMPASANPEMSRFPFHEDGSSHPGSARPPLQHHATEPVGFSQDYSSNNLMVPRTISQQDNRISMGSLIDLDESLPDPVMSSDIPRPSTANSDAVSEVGSAFDLERHTSYISMPSSNREPSIYVSDDSN
ncbi:kinase-like protein, partial [Cryphonectria parasitica EP155]